MSRKVLIFLGPPGAGKGTQASRLAQDAGLKKLSSGDILRDHVARKTALGVQVQSVLERGELVSDDLMRALLREELMNLQNGAILDGFVRTTPQAKALEEMLSELGVSLQGVILLEVSENELVARLKNRAKTEGRTDDTEETIRRRLEVYKEQTEPLVDYYQSKELLQRVDGLGDPEQIYTRLRGIV